jgi:peroxiredoxin
MEPQIGALPEIGTLIHDFSLPCYHPTPAPGHTQVRRLYDSFGTRGLVLYFYPKDDTPGCTV